MKSERYFAVTFGSNNPFTIRKMVRKMIAFLVGLLILTTPVHYTTLCTFNVLFHGDTARLDCLRRIQIWRQTREEPHIGAQVYSDLMN